MRTTPVPTILFISASFCADAILSALGCRSKPSEGCLRRSKGMASLNEERPSELDRQPEAITLIHCHRIYGGTLVAIVRNSAGVSGSLRNSAMLHVAPDCLPMQRQNHKRCAADRS